MRGVEIDPVEMRVLEAVEEIDREAPLDAHLAGMTARQPLGARHRRGGGQLAVQRVGADETEGLAMKQVPGIDQVEPRGLELAQQHFREMRPEHPDLGPDAPRDDVFLQESPIPGVPGLAMGQAGGLQRVDALQRRQLNGPAHSLERPGQFLATYSGQARPIRRLRRPSSRPSPSPRRCRRPCRRQPRAGGRIRRSPPP